MMRRTRSWVAAAALLATAGAPQAALVKNGDGTITDTSTHLVWLQDWSDNGKQTWATQRAWAENLSFAGSSDWALPSIDDFIDLYFELGGVIEVGGFVHVQDNDYWVGTEIVAGSRAWVFHPKSGSFNGLNETLALYAVAVRRGDGAAPVPEPQTLVLALLALGATALTHRRRWAADPGAACLGALPRGKGKAVASTARPLQQVS